MTKTWYSKTEADSLFGEKADLVGGKVPAAQLPDGTAGTGPAGESAYQLAVDQGFVGTEAEWLASLVGPEGPQGVQGPAGADSTVPGPQGPKGDTGATGPAGPGLPMGGTTGQIPAKASATDYDVDWIDPPTGGAGLPSTVVNKTGAYTASAGDFVEADTTAAGFTVTLPSAPAVGALVAVKKVDATANTLTIVPSGTGNIDGDPNATTTTKMAGAVFEHVGADVWRIVASMTTTGPAGPQGPAGPTGAAGATGPTGPAGTNGAISQLQDEGTNLTVRPTINFVGAGVTATDDSANGRTVVTIPGGGGSGGLTSGFVSGARYSFGAQSGQGGLTVNTLYFMPFVVQTAAATTFNAITVFVQAAAATAGSTIRLGIYADAGGKPGSLVVDAGTVDSTTTGLKDAAIAQALSPGVYWLACVPLTSQPVVYLTAAGGIGNFPPLPIDPGSFNTTNTWSRTGVTGALPATAGTLAQTALFPRIMMKAA